MILIDLGGTWTLKRPSDGSTRPIAVPGDIASALLDSGELSDPYRGQAELDALWIGREDWIIERELTLGAPFLDHERIFLEADSIDTIAQVTFNGTVIGESRNMFTRFHADITGLARPGVNTLCILIRSPELSARAAAAKLPYPVPASVYPVSSPHRNLIRKAQCMSGWDWGPCIMTGGVYDGIRLAALDGPRVLYANARPVRGPDGWKLACDFTLDAARTEESILGASIMGMRVQTTAKASVGISTHRLELDVPDPELWWPVGYGRQTLYEARLEVSTPERPENVQAIVKLVGFREIRLVNEPDDAGRSMAFEVNGRRIFAKGANWIPQDALPSRWSDDRAKGLLDSALQANMNMIRVWGGGRYESDAFYDHCDRTGLLVWQDFMFSCATYPSDEDFLSTVAAEVRHQVRRLSDHPSIALWCGNNEDLGAIAWFDETRRHPARYIEDYERLNEGVIGRLVRELDPDRPWWPGSPSAGAGDYSDNWHSDASGDMHYWSVWHEGKPFSAYLEVRPRLCSEFGFQSLPSSQSARSFADGEQLSVTSPVMERHQRHPKGNELILSTMHRYFRMPAGFTQTLYLSQVQQAMAIKTAAEYWRSLMPHCMGVLYWQLNDVWPCSSWSSVEYDGRWKLLHYEARRFFAPILLALIVQGETVRASLVNESGNPISGELLVALRDFTGSVISEFRMACRIEGDEARDIWETTLSGLPAAVDRCFATAEFLPDPGSQAPERAWTFLTEPKRCSLPSATIRAVPRTDGNDPESPELVLSTDAPAFYILPEFEGHDGYSSEAGFLLLPGERQSIHYVPASGEIPPEAHALTSSVRFMHLRASYD